MKTEDICVIRNKYITRENILSKEEYLAYVKEYESDICALKKQKESLKKQIEEKDKVTPIE